MILTQKTAKLEKERLYHKQNGICLICELPLDTDIQKNHLDHDHALDGENAGRVRGLLCNLCNPAEGNVLHKFNRSGLKTKINHLQWFKNLVKYWEQDITDNVIHPKFIPDKAKQFSRLTKTEMQQVMREHNYEYNDKDDRKILLSKFKKQFRKDLQCN